MQSRSFSLRRLKPIRKVGNPPSVVPRAPSGAGEAGRRLWRAVLGEFELAEHD